MASSQQFEAQMGKLDRILGGTYIDILKGNVSGQSIINKYGAIDDLTTTLTPITTSGTYQVPTVLTSLEMLSDDNTNDKAGGSGALTVRVYGISTGWLEDTEDVTLNGTTAVALSTQFFRIYRMKVLTSGTYGDAVTPSHDSTITLRTASAGVTWAVIGTEDGYGFAQSLVSVFSVPEGKTAYPLDEVFTVESNKTITLFFFARENADDITTPYDPVRLKQLHRGLDGFHVNTYPAGLGGFVGPCDFGYMGKTSTGTADVAVQFAVLLIDN